MDCQCPGSKCEGHQTGIDRIRKVMHAFKGERDRRMVGASSCKPWSAPDGSSERAVPGQKPPLQRTAENPCLVVGSTEIQFSEPAAGTESQELLPNEMSRCKLEPNTQQSTFSHGSWWKRAC
jgi:hypothetical protein